MDDDRIRLMGLIVRTHRRLTDSLGRELEQNVGIPLVFFDVLIHVGGAPESRLTMSKLSADVALTTGGVTRLVDRMVEAGLVARQNCPSDRRSIYVVLTPRGRRYSTGPSPPTSTGSTATWWRTSKPATVPRSRRR